MMQLFELRASLTKNTRLALEVGGLGIILLIWMALTASGTISSSLLPSPFAVLRSFKELHFEDALIRNLFFSVKLNVMGYAEAILIAYPLGL